MVIMNILILFAVVTLYCLTRLQRPLFAHGSLRVVFLSQLSPLCILVGFIFFRNVVKKPKFSLRMKCPEYVLLYTDELKASRLGKTFLMNPFSFDL